VLNLALGELIREYSSIEQFGTSDRTNGQLSVRRTIVRVRLEDSLESDLQGIRNPEFPVGWRTDLESDLQGIRNPEFGFRLQEIGFRAIARGHKIPTLGFVPVSRDDVSSRRNWEIYILRGKAILLFPHFLVEH